MPVESLRTAFRPLVKWPGGKSREWREIAPHVPPRVRHFVDPFMGGLAPFGLTPFSGRAYLNDRHARLVDLHVRVQRRDPELREELEELAEDWDALAAVADTLASLFRELVGSGRGGRSVSPTRVGNEVAAALEAVELERAHAHVLASVRSKAERLPRLERRHGMTFDRAELARHAETAVRAGYYTMVRETERSARGAVAAAQFLFVRDYCYGAMFRRNAEGEFNIPYGGTSYNGKRFRTRVDQLWSAPTAAALSRARFSCGDFEPFLEGLAGELGEEDLCFADPPYDSDFRAYGEHDFTIADHERLAAALRRLPCPWLLVIKATPEVRRVYLSGEGSRLVHEFDRTYGYNVRGRNDRDTRHLVVAGRA